MARGKRKSIEERIIEKEEFICSLQARIKSEQKDLEALCREKRHEDLETLNELIKSSGLSEYEVTKAIESYITTVRQNAS